MAEVYWIRLPEHTDMFKEGYVGITSKTAKERFKSHIKESKRKDRKKYRIHNAISKYSESIILETLVICDDDYAIDLESKLRPKPKIGWNTLAGGNNVKLLRDIKDTFKHSDESINKMRKTHTKIWSENRETRLISIASLRKKIDRPTDENGQPTRFWVGRYKKSPNLKYWSEAQSLRDVYDLNPNCSSVELMAHVRADRNKKQWFQTLLRYFDGGWIPKEDQLWLNDFTEGRWHIH